MKLNLIFNNQKEITDDLFFSQVAKDAFIQKIASKDLSDLSYRELEKIAEVLHTEYGIKFAADTADGEKLSTEKNKKKQDDSTSKVKSVNKFDAYTWLDYWFGIAGSNTSLSKNGLLKEYSEYYKKYMEDYENKKGNQYSDYVNSLTYNPNKNETSAEEGKQNFELYKQHLEEVLLNVKNSNDSEIIKDFIRQSSLSADKEHKEEIKNVLASDDPLYIESYLMNLWYRVSDKSDIELAIDRSKLYTNPKDKANYLKYFIKKDILSETTTLDEQNQQNILDIEKKIEVAKQEKIKELKEKLFDLENTLNTGNLSSGEEAKGYLQGTLGEGTLTGDQASAGARSMPEENKNFVLKTIADKSSQNPNLKEQERVQKEIKGLNAALIKNNASITEKDILIKQLEKQIIDNNRTIQENADKPVEEQLPQEEITNLKTLGNSLYNQLSKATTELLAIKGNNSSATTELSGLEKLKNELESKKNSIESTSESDLILKLRQDLANQGKVVKDLELKLNDRKLPLGEKIGLDKQLEEAQTKYDYIKAELENEYFKAEKGSNYRTLKDQRNIDLSKKQEKSTENLKTKIKSLEALLAELPTLDPEEQLKKLGIDREEFSPNDLGKIELGNSLVKEDLDTMSIEELTQIKNAIYSTLLNNLMQADLMLSTQEIANREITANVTNINAGYKQYIEPLYGEISKFAKTFNSLDQNEDEINNLNSFANIMKHQGDPKIDPNKKDAFTTITTAIKNLLPTKGTGNTTSITKFKQMLDKFKDIPEYTRWMGNEQINKLYKYTTAKANNNVQKSLLEIQNTILDPLDNFAELLTTAKSETGKNTREKKPVTDQPKEETQQEGESTKKPKKEKEKKYNLKEEIDKNIDNIITRYRQTFGEQGLDVNTDDQLSDSAKNTINSIIGKHMKGIIRAVGDSTNPSFDDSFTNINNKVTGIEKTKVKGEKERQEDIEKTITNNNEGEVLLAYGKQKRTTSQLTSNYMGYYDFLTLWQKLITSCAKSMTGVLAPTAGEEQRNLENPDDDNKYGDDNFPYQPEILSKFVIKFNKVSKDYKPSAYPKYVDMSKMSESERADYMRTENANRDLYSGTTSAMWTQAVKNDQTSTDLDTINRYLQTVIDSERIDKFSYINNAELFNNIAKRINNTIYKNENGPINLMMIEEDSVKAYDKNNQIELDNIVTTINANFFDPQKDINSIIEFIKPENIITIKGKKSNAETSEFIKNLINSLNRANNDYDKFKNNIVTQSSEEDFDTIMLNLKQEFIEKLDSYKDTLKSCIEFNNKYIAIKPENNPLAMKIKFKLTYNVPLSDIEKNALRNTFATPRGKAQSGGMDKIKEINQVNTPIENIGRVIQPKSNNGSNAEFYNLPEEEQKRLLDANENK